MASQQPDKVTLLANGRVWQGWKSATITAGIDQAARTFSVTAADSQKRFLEQGAAQIGDAVQVLVAGVPVLTGWLEKFVEAESAGSHDLTLQGRSRTCDLVDASEEVAPGQWRNRTLLEIATAIAAPFGVAVELDGPDQPIPCFDVDVGETAFDAIEELSRMYGCLVSDTAAGILRLARAGFEGAQGALEGCIRDGAQRGNVLGWTLTADGSQLFSEYVVRGQQASSDRRSGTASAEIAGRATDPAVTRYRPKIITAEAAGDRAYCQQRAEWEMGQAIASGVSLDLSVTGWRQAGGALWRPGLLVPVTLHRDGVVKVDQVMVLADITWSLDVSGGTVTQMTLRDPAGYQLAPEAPKRPDKAGTARAKKAGEGGGSDSYALLRAVTGNQ